MADTNLTYFKELPKFDDKSTNVDLKSVRGWGNTLTSMPDYSENNVFLGNPNVTQNTLPFVDPWIGGYGKIFCLQAPIFFDTVLKAQSARMMERFCKGLSGLSNYELQTTEVTYGNNAETFTVPTGIKKGNNQFSLKFPELRRGFFRHLFKYWVTGISDLGSGYGTYHGKVWETGLRFSSVNHTAIIAYGLTDNSGGGYGLDSLEFACMWFASFPTQVPNDHFNYSQGEHNTQEIDEQFYGIFHENNTINAFVAELLLKSNFYKDNYDDFNLGSLTWDGFAKRISDTGDSLTNVGFEPLQADSTQYSNIIKPEGLMAQNYVPPKKKP